MFLFKASTILNELRKFEPEIVKICNESLKKGKQDLIFRIYGSFKTCSNIPIDIAVMKKLILDL